MEYVTDKRVQSKLVLIKYFLFIHGVIKPACLQSQNFSKFSIIRLLLHDCD